MSDLRGETIRWTFDDGPTKGKAFEHTFNMDGSVSYKMAGSDKITRENKVEVIETTDNVVVVSYLAHSGWTLTAVLDEKTREVTAIASNAEDLVVQHGHFEHLRRAST
jgi:hypothetical protein